MIIVPNPTPMPMPIFSPLLNPCLPSEGERVEFDGVGGIVVTVDKTMSAVVEVNVVVTPFFEVDDIAVLAIEINEEIDVGAADVLEIIDSGGAILI